MAAVVCHLPYRKPGLGGRLRGYGRCIQANGEGKRGGTHRGALRHAYDFRLKEGTEVLAARDGIVCCAVDHFAEGGIRQDLRARANFVALYHPDIDLYSRYYHLKLGGVQVEERERVTAGTVLGLSGNTGFSGGPHLHFDVTNSLPEAHAALAFSFESQQGTLACIPASFSGALPFGVPLRLICFNNSSGDDGDLATAVGVPTGPVAALVFRSGGGKKSFVEIFRETRTKCGAEADAKLIIIANSVPGPEIFQMGGNLDDVVDETTSAAVALGCVMVSKEAGEALCHQHPGTFIEVKRVEREIRKRREGENGALWSCVTVPCTFEGRVDNKTCSCHCM